MELSDAIPVGEHGLDPMVHKGFLPQAELGEDRIDVLLDRRVGQAEVRPAADWA